MGWLLEISFVLFVFLNDKGLENVPIAEFSNYRIFLIKECSNYYRMLKLQNAPITGTFIEVFPMKQGGTSCDKLNLIQISQCLFL